MNSNKKKLSILIITFNQENFITKTLDSIVSQKHNYDYEIVIGEDCSKDGTRDVIKQYEKKYPGIIKPIYNEVNLGLVKNYFNTLAACSGEYIMECAGDDYWLDDKVLTQIDFMDKNPDVGMCYGKALCWIDNLNKFSKNTIGKKKETFSDFVFGNEVPAPTVCYRKDLMFEYVKQIEPLTKNWKMEDLPQWLWFSKRTKISFLDKSFAVYRVSNESASHSKDMDKELAFLNSARDIKLYFSDSEEDRKLVNEVYYADLANLYSTHGDLKNYRKYLKLSGSKHAKKRLMQSYIPFFLTFKKIATKIR